MRLLPVLLFLAGCTASPAFSLEFSQQYDPWSDWVLQSERDWTPGESQARIIVHSDTEWERGKYTLSAGGEAIVAGPWDQAFVTAGVRRTFFDRLGVELELAHQIDGMTEPFLRTDQKQWQGHNPFLHLRLSWEFDPAFSIGLSSGKSLFQGFPFEKEEGEPDLYHAEYDVTVRLLGKRGLFSKEHKHGN